MSDESRKAVIYCRVSDPKQKTEGHGLESQEHRCRQYAMDKQYLVEKVFRDDVSGGGDFAKRPAMNALLTYLKRNKKTDYVVIFDDLKRFSRDVYFYWGLMKELERHKAVPECPNFVFEQTPEGKLQQSVSVAAGEYERESNRRQTFQKMKARLEAGFHVFIAPVGFEFTKDKQKGKLLVKKEPEASVIQEAMEGFANGRFQTKREVKLFLENASDFPKTASGKIGNTRVDQILANPLYAGYVGYETWDVPVQKGQHEGMVSYETFCKVQERLNGRANAPARVDINHDFPLAALSPVNAVIL